VSGHVRSPGLSPIDRPYTSFYRHFVVTLAADCFDSEISLLLYSKYATFVHTPSTFTKNFETLTFHGVCDSINLCCVILTLFLILTFYSYSICSCDAIVIYGKLLVHARALLSCYHVLVSTVITVSIFSE